MTGRRTYMIAIAVLFVARSAWSQVVNTTVSATLSRLADTAHLEFEGRKNWRYDLKRESPTRITITVPALDDASVARLQGFSDPLVRDVHIDKSGPDGGDIVTLELARPDVESFDYLTDDPSRLIVDFYRKAEAEVKKQAVRSEVAPKAKKGKSNAKAAARTAAKTARKPAGDEFLSVDTPAGGEGQTAADGDVRLHFGIFDGGDENYDRFRIKDYEIRDDAIIAARNNIYLPFPMLKMKVSRLDKLIEESPEYVIHPKNTRENKEARLLLALYQRKRYAVFMKTFDYFTHRYPESEYTEIVKNLAASVHLTKWRESGDATEYDLARAGYNELVQKYPDSPLREHNYLILGFMQVERGEALASLQTLEGFRSAYPKSPAIPQVRKALAEAYMILHKYDDATAEYQAIIKDFPGSDDAREARYRLGDVLFAKGDDSGAVVAYEAAIKEYPAQEKIYPNADFNMAEARFLQKDYKKSLNGYVQFVELYPTHEYGGYALTRIGELLGILGADQRREMGAYLESYFRFPDHPGAKVARIRMLSRQMRGMKETEEKHALAEIRKYADQLDVPGIKEFTTLMTAEGLANRGEYTAALQDLIAFYQKNPGSTNLTTFKGRILRNIANQMKALVDKGDFIQALKFHSLYSNTWLKNTDRIDIPYLLAGAYERAGAYSEAEEIYKKDLKRRKAIVGTDEEKEKKVQEHLPSVDELSLRVAATMFQDRDYHGAYERLKAMGKTPELTPAEVIERVRLSASIAEQRNDPERARAALLELADKWQGDPALLAPVNLQLAQTLMKLGDAKRAETYADRVLQVEGAGTEVPGKTVADAYTVKGDAQLAQKKPMAAVETYQKLLERFESKMPLAKVRYEVGQILFDRGDLKGAADVWRRLEGTPGEFLAKVGKEKLADSEWREQYKKYINRFPAMAKGGTKGSQP